MIQINKSILHILDLASGLSVASQREMDPGNDVAVSYLARHIEKAFSSATIQTGEIKPGSAFLQETQRYLSGELDFVAYSQSIGERTYEILGRTSKAEATDLVLCDFVMEERRGLALFLFYNKTAYTHYVNQDEDGVWNDIIRHHALLPSGAQKVESFAIIDPTSGQVHFADRKVEVDGHSACILPDLLLECSSLPSSKDTLQIVEKTAKTIAENHGQDAVVAVSKAKSYVNENTGVSGELLAEELVREVFKDDAVMQREFVEEAQRQGLPEKAQVNTAYAARKSRTHKIKTDTGIELSIPVEYFEDSEFVEFINNPDGSIAIALKNINQILN